DQDRAVLVFPVYIALDDGPRCPKPQAKPALKSSTPQPPSAEYATHELLHAYHIARLGRADKATVDQWRWTLEATAVAHQSSGRAKPPVRSQDWAPMRLDHSLDWTPDGCSTDLAIYEAGDFFVYAG